MMRRILPLLLALGASVSHGQVVIRQNGTENNPHVVADLKTGTSRSSRRHAIVVNGDWVVLLRAHVTSSGDDGIKVYGRNVSIIDSLIENTQDQGIACHRGRNLTVEDCTIRDCGNQTRDHGLYFSGTGHRIVGNTFSGCHGYGIHAYQEPTGDPDTGVSGSVVMDNTIRNTVTGRAIVWQSGTGGNLIAGNVVEGLDKDRQFKILRLRSSDMVAGNSWQDIPSPPTLAELYREIIEREAADDTDVDEDRVRAVIAELQQLVSQEVRAAKQQK